MPFKLSSVIIIVSLLLYELWKFDYFLNSSTHKKPHVFELSMNIWDNIEPPADLELIGERLECSALS